jgi:hypothetical protein
MLYLCAVAALVSVSVVPAYCNIFFIEKSQQKTCRSRFFDIEKQLNGLAEAQVRNGNFSHVVASIAEA